MGKVKTHLFEFKAAHVELLSGQKQSGVIRDRCDTGVLTLVQMKIKKEAGTPVIYLLTNARPSTPDELARVARSMSEQIFDGFRNEIQSLQRRLLGMGEIADDKTKLFVRGEDRTARFKKK